MSLLQISELRPLVSSPLSDPQLQTVIDRVEAEIADLIGPDSSGGDYTEELEGGGCDLFLRRPISAMVSVTEYSSLSDTTGTALTENTDYRAWGKQGRLRRIGSRWSARAVVVYTPADRDTERKQATIDLVRIVLLTSPLLEERVEDVGDYKTPENWEAQKQRVLSRLVFKGF